VNVLGIIAFGKTPAACLLRDGKIVAFGEEERFTRLKGSHGMFPGKAVQYCLDEAGLGLAGVDRIGFAWDAGKYPYHMLGSLGRQYWKYRGAASRAWHHQDDGGGGMAGVFNAAANVLRTPAMLREEVARTPGAGPDGRRAADRVRLAPPLPPTRPTSAAPSTRPSS
jgi:predicted NodU family carbamoyl transferase